MEISMNLDDLKVGHVYKAKRSRVVGSLVFPYWNDREIIWMGITDLQYDGPTVKTGQRFPKMDIKKFLEWAGEDVTHLMDDDGSWRAASR